MTEDDRNYYIDVLMLRYPFKARSYFDNMPDTELLREYEKAITL